MSTPVAALKPIKTGMFGAFRFIRQSYNNPPEHSQFLRERFGDVVMQRAGLRPSFPAALVPHRG
jgi:hypothetical protein